MEISVDYSAGEYFVFIAILSYLLFCAIISGNIAKQKGYEFIDWLFVGFIFNVFAIIAIGAYQPKSTSAPSPPTPSKS